MFRLLAAHRDWTQHFLAEPSLLGGVDSFGIELIHPRREGRSARQVGKKGEANLRWIVGAKLSFVLTAFSLCSKWDGLRADEDGFVAISLLRVAL